MSKALNGIVQLVSEQINSEILISTQTENIIDQFMNKSFLMKWPHGCKSDSHMYNSYEWLL